MPSTPTFNEIVTTKHIRDFLQFGAARPTNLPNYYGADAQYIVVDSAANPEFGKIGPIWVPDPRTTSGRYKLVAKTIAPPGSLPTATITLREKHGFVPRQFGRLGDLNIYENVGACNDPSDFLNGWNDFVVIYSYGLPETKTYGKRGDFKADDPAEDKINYTLESIYAIGKMTIGEKYSATFEVLDVIYASNITLAVCGAPNDGTKWIYALINSGAGPTAAQIAYSLDGGATFSTTAITGILNTAVPDVIRLMGNFLIVTSSTENAYYYTTLSSTGVPGAFTKVTTGIVSGKGPTDIWVANQREAYACGLGGYLYKLTDPTAGVTVLDPGAATTANLTKINGLADGSEIVAVGATTKVVISQNRGQTWALAASTPGAAALNSVWVVQPGLYWIVDAVGAARYTQNGGASWTVITIPGAWATMKDVCFPTKEVGFIVGATSGPLGLVAATWNGGQSWSGLSSTRLQNVLAAQRVDRIAFPDVAALDPEVACDNIALACLGDAGVTGAVALGQVARL